MGMTMRVSLPGYDALTDGTIDHYSIYADSDNILIKEKTRGTISVSGFGTVNHNLGYVPLIYAYLTDGTTATFCTSTNGFGQFDVYATTNDYIVRSISGTRTFKYFIFHDQQV